MHTSQKDSPVSAAIFMIAAMAIIGIIDNYIVRLADTIGLWQFHFLRGVMMLPLIVIMSLICLPPLR